MKKPARTAKAKAKAKPLKKTAAAHTPKKPPRPKRLPKTSAALSPESASPSPACDTLAIAQSELLQLTEGGYWDIAEETGPTDVPGITIQTDEPGASIQETVQANAPTTVFDPFRALLETYEEGGERDDAPFAEDELCAPTVEPPSEVVAEETQTVLYETAPPPFDPPPEDNLEPPWNPGDGYVLHDIPESVLADCFAAASAPGAHRKSAPAIKNTYLDRARRAALENAAAAAPETKLFGFQFGELKRLAIGVTAGLAAPLLFGIWTLSGRAPAAPQENTPDLLAPTSAEAAITQTPPAPDYAAAYRTALQRLDSGRARDGAALLRDAAEGGFALAQYRLANLYERGEGVPQNLALAREWAEQAARAGHCRAMHDTGVYYARGDGAPVDETAAFRWFRQAAEFGVTDSQYNLGLLYQQGRGVSANAEEALFWFLVAARQHDVNAVDRAVDLATQLADPVVDRAQARARAFSPRLANPVANEENCAGA